MTSSARSLSWLDEEFTKAAILIQSKGVALPTHTVLNFTSGLDVAEDVGNDSNDVSTTVSSAATVNGGQTIQAAAGAVIDVDTSTGNATVLLPASPAADTKIEIADVGGKADVYPIVVDANGSTIAGLSKLPMSSPYDCLLLRFNATKGVWVIR